jgi:hypothetical protein
MVCAYLHPAASKALAALEELPPLRRGVVRAGLLAGCGALFALYYTHIYTLPKKQYNEVGEVEGGWGMVGGNTFEDMFGVCVRDECWMFGLRQASGSL